MRNTIACLAPLLLSATITAQPRAAQAPPGGAANTTSQVLTQYCITCHNQTANAGNLALDSKNVNQVGADAHLWEKVARKVRAGLMPPSGARRPAQNVLDEFAADVERRLDQAAAANPNPGNPGLHRLNRTEYGNAVRDLLHLDVDVAAMLPADSSSDGFDNIAEALSFSPSLIQGYVSAAMKISRRAVGDRTQIQTQVTYQAPPSLAQDRHIDGLPLGTRGGMVVRHTFPVDGEYEFTITAAGVGGGNATSLVGGGGDGFSGGAGNIPGPLLDVTIDDEKVAVPNTRQFTIPVKAGPHTIGMALMDQRRAAGVDDIYSVYAVGGAVNNVTINGPLNSSGVGDTPSRRRIFVCTPQTADQESPCAERIISTLAKRAFRRAPTAGEIQTLVSFYEQGRKDADFESGIQLALARLLVSPRFLFRIEEEPAGVRPGQAYRLDDLALASRLSFFLWSSIPDDELLEIAIAGRLSNPAVLQEQIKRMVADPRSESLIRNFGGQWLYLRELEGAQPMASNFDDNLRHSFRRETELLLENIIRSDESLLKLLDAEYTFVDERLARHYGIPNIRGSYFRRVPLTATSPRRGILGQGSILTVTSIATRTSPVIRGKWILENLLGSPPPNPPPGVEVDLDADAEAVKTMTLRQRLEMHRESAVCASCHRMMDPLGLALENFDHVGTWREMDGPSPIDAGGELVDGTPLSGPLDVRNAVLAKKETFVTTAIERLMTYAIGRAIEPSDMPAVRAIVRRAAQNDYRALSVISGIVESAPFRMKMKKD